LTGVPDEGKPATQRAASSTAAHSARESVLASVARVVSSAFPQTRLQDRIADPGPVEILVAFSGGPDSTALLAALTELSPELGILPVAGHFDHALDAESASRANRAAELAKELGVPFSSERRQRALPSGRGIEAAARELRYEYLEGLRCARGAPLLAVAHHRDDQVETLLMRILQGTGIYGLAGIPRHRDHLIRPLLDIPRETIEHYLQYRGIVAISDPTNLDPAAVRNRVRHALLPHLRRQESNVESELLKLRSAAYRANRSVERQLDRWIDRSPTPVGADRHPVEVGVEMAKLRALPREIQVHLLSHLHRVLGATYPPRRAAVTELLRQLEGSTSTIGVDCGDGWRWRSLAGRLITERSPAAEAQRTPLFAYTLRIPGEVEIPEIAASIQIRREAKKPWMFRGSPTRAALELPATDGDVIEIRNRRPGDRLQPLGCDYERRLKEIFIDEKVSRDHRARVPLLIWNQQIVWVPGITIDERYRLRDEESESKTLWTARIQPLNPT